jgi:hypothetical protein
MFLEQAIAQSPRGLARRAKFADKGAMDNPCRGQWVVATAGALGLYFKFVWADTGKTAGVLRGLDEDKYVRAYSDWEPVKE